MKPSNSHFLFLDPFKLFEMMTWGVIRTKVFFTITITVVCVHLGLWFFQLWYIFKSENFHESIKLYGADLFVVFTVSISVLHFVVYKYEASSIQSFQTII